jgi:cytochrome c-type biogenesis protein CcmH
MKRAVLFSFFLPLLLAGVITNSVHAQEPDPQPTPSDNEVNRIARNLYCPVCENVPLDVCGTLACIQWREQIREKLALGWSDEQIYAFFQEQYGDRALAQPPARGLNLLVYVAPPVLILGAGYLLLRALRGWRQPETEAASAGNQTASQPDDEYISRLEEELRKRE